MPSSASSDAEPTVLARLDRLRDRWLVEGPSAALVRRFRRLVLDHYDRHGRPLPWRDEPTPYRVVVSEIMLQQTGVARVAEKFPPFVALFPDFAALARAPLALVLQAWRGLGYHRRAVALRALATEVMTDHGGRLPEDPSVLRTLPGLGPATAASVAAFAFDAPVAFLETNLRALFIHLAFPAPAVVHDRDLLPLVASTMDRTSPRRWYNALMDLGTLVKRHRGNAARRSVHHTRQSPFQGSRRQLRARLLHLLVDGGPATPAALARLLERPGDEVAPLLDELVSEGFLTRRGPRVAVVLG